MKIYFDNNSTTKIDKRVVDKMLPYLYEDYGNPSSTHRTGQLARTAVDEAREIIASYISATPLEIIFTSSGTESNNWVFKGVVESMKEKGNHIITTCIEHSSIEKTCKHLEFEGVEISYVGIDKNGHVDIEEIKSKVTPKTILISVQYANNEIGTIMPIRDIGKFCKKNGILFHTDAMQAVKYLPLNVLSLKVDFMTFGAHKINGPKGIGVLYIKKNTKIAALIDGGQQEFGLRAGTENVPYIVGFGEAIKILKNEIEERSEKVREIRDHFEKLISESIKDIKFNGGEPRLPNVSSITFNGISSDSFLARLDMEGIFASAGSACTSGSILASNTLIAMGLTQEETLSTIRFSFSHLNTIEEVEYSVDVIKKLITSLRNI